MRALKGQGYDVAGISSDLEQTDRISVLSDFRSRKVRVLVATDVISRGIDIKDINMVINYDVPNDAEDYVHRIGRTARAETTGIGITLICEEGMYKVLQIERLIEKEIEKLPLPGHLGRGPEWDPKPFRKGGRGGGKGGSGKRGGRGDGKRRSGGRSNDSRKNGKGGQGNKNRRFQNKKKGSGNRGGGQNSGGSKPQRQG